MTRAPRPRAGLSRAWLALALFALVGGALLAAVVAAARTPWIGAAPFLRAGFAPALTLHVTLATLVWLPGIACAAWVALPAGPRGAGSRALGLGWLNWACALAGVAALLASGVASVLGVAGAGAAVLANYVPVIDDVVFLSGIAVFAAAVLGTGTHALWRTLRALQRTPARTGPRRAAWTPWRVAAAAAVLPMWMAVATLALQWNSGGAREGLARGAESLFWGPGHLLQFSYVLLAMAGWLWLLRARAGHSPVVAAAIVLAAAPALAGPVLAAWPGLEPPSLRAAFTDLMRGFSWPGPALLVAHLAWRAWRERSSPRARSASAGPGPASKRGDPPASRASAGERAALASIALFALGVGVALLIRGDTTTVPAHYHGTIGAATLAGIAFVIRAGVGRSRAHGAPWRIATLYASGFALLVTGLALAGHHRVPRKLADAGAAAHGDAAFAGLVAMALGALLAIAAIAWLGAAAVRAFLRASRGPRPRPITPVRVRARLRAVTHRPDPRRRVLAATAAAVLALGTVFSWLGGRDGDAGAPSTAAAPSAPAGGELHDRFQQGVWMLHARKFEHALTAFHRVLAVRPDMPEAHVNMGFALLGLGRHREAKAFFESAIDLRPEQLNAYYGLATALEAGGDVRGAIGAMRTYTHLTRGDDPYLRRARAALWEWENARGTRGPRR